MTNKGCIYFGVKKFLFLLLVVGVLSGLLGYLVNGSVAVSTPPLTDYERAKFLPDLYLQEAGKKLEEAGSYKFELQWVTVNEDNEEIGAAEISGVWSSNGGMVVDEISHFPDGTEAWYAYAFTKGKMMKAVSVAEGKDEWVWVADEEEIRDKKYYLYALLIDKAGRLFEHLGPSLYLATYNDVAQIEGQDVYLFEVMPEPEDVRFLETDDMELEDLYYEFAVSTKTQTLVGAQIHAIYNTPDGLLMDHITILYESGAKVKLPEVKGGNSK